MVRRETQRFERQLTCCCHSYFLVQKAKDAGSDQRCYCFPRARNRDMHEQSASDWSLLPLPPPDAWI
jgi:hypothetical protein